MKFKSPYYVKVFFGTRTNPCDEELNYWISRHPNIYIEDIKYAQPTAEEYSVCLLYSDDYKGERL